MEAYLMRLLAASAINLAFLVPFFAAAYGLTKPRPGLRPALLFVAFFVLDMACIWLFKLAVFIPSWGHYNWQGKVLETAWPVLLAFSVTAFAPAKIGLTLPREPRSWRILGYTCLLYVLVMVPLLLYLAGGHPKFGADLPAYVYEGTMPGLAEEFAYRGVLLALLNEAFGRPWKFAGIRLGWGFVIVTAMFGFLHGIDATSFGDFHIYWSGMIFPVLTGVVLAWLRERTGSVWPGVLFHNFVNLINTLFG
ncbi:MAG: lysostaphin resistance A-like protein [Bacillota bacterium]